MDFVNFLQLHSRVGLIILTLMAVLWLISLLLKDSSIVDIFWGTGFVISAWTAFLLTTSTLTPRHWLIAILTTIWGLRLSTHIFLRNMGRGEDFRYAKWRAENGKSWWWKSFFKVFLTQGILMWIIASPLTASQLPGQPDKLIWLDFVAILAPNTMHYPVAMSAIDAGFPVFSEKPYTCNMDEALNLTRKQQSTSLAYGIAFDVDFNADPFFVRKVDNIADAFDFFIFDKLSNFFY